MCPSSAYVSFCEKYFFKNFVYVEEEHIFFSFFLFLEGERWWRFPGFELIIQTP